MLLVWFAMRSVDTESKERQRHEQNMAKVRGTLLRDSTLGSRVVDVYDPAEVQQLRQSRLPRDFT